MCKAGKHSPFYRCLPPVFACCDKLALCAWRAKLLGAHEVARTSKTACI